MNQAPSRTAGQYLQDRLSRLLQQIGLLAGGAVVFAALVLFAGLSLVGAMIGFAALLAGIALLPTRANSPSDPDTAASPLPLDMPASTVAIFADALIEPCLVLDRRRIVLHANLAARQEYPGVSTGNPISFSMRNPDLVRAIDVAMRTGRTSSIELHETVPSQTWHKVVVAPLNRPGLDWLSDEDRQLLVTFQSLTELKQVEALRSDFIANARSEEHTSELQSRPHLVCRLLLEKIK